VADTELFGCDGDEDGRQLYLPPPLVENNYLMGGIYRPDESGAGPGSVLLCGGTLCDGSCDRSRACFEWRPDVNVGEWTEVSAELNQRRNGPLLARMPHPDRPGEQVILAAGGNSVNTEYYDETLDEWVPHENLPRPWTTVNCFVQLSDGALYLIDSQVNRLNVDGWLLDPPLAETPEDAVEISRCAATEYQGREGIYVRNGFFFDPSDNSWTQLEEIPTPSSTNRPNEMWSFRGLPTVFGAPSCGGLNDCTNDEVIQFSPDDNEWRSLGRMRRPRRFHEMVEVPREFCDFVSPIDTTTEAPATTVSPAPEGPTAAIVLGGYSAGFTDSALAQAEIFGCPTKKDLAQPLFKSFLSGGVYVEGAAGDRYVLMCGGNLCGEGPCTVTDRCLEYRPTTNEWTEGPTLVSRRYSHVMANIPIAEDAPEIILPSVIGFLRSVEILSPRDFWTQFDDLPDNSWMSLDCMIVYNDKLYHAERIVQEFDFFTWEPTQIGVVTDEVGEPKKCAGVEINGVPGIYVRSGYWFNLDTRMWEPKEPVPVTDGNPANAMWSFGGRPTVFGAGRCNALGECEFDQVRSKGLVLDQVANLLAGDPISTGL